MACSLYNNNGYGCGGCIHFVKTNIMILIQISGRRKKQNIIKQINKTKSYILYII